MQRNIALRLSMTALVLLVSACGTTNGTAPASFKTAPPTKAFLVTGGQTSHVSGLFTSGTTFLVQIDGRPAASHPAAVCPIHNRRGGRLIISCHEESRGDRKNISGITREASLAPGRHTVLLGREAGQTYPPRVVPRWRRPADLVHRAQLSFTVERPGIRYIGNIFWSENRYWAWIMRFGLPDEKKGIYIVAGEPPPAFIANWKKMVRTPGFVVCKVISRTKKCRPLNE